MRSKALGGWIGLGLGIAWIGAPLATTDVSAQEIDVSESAVTLSSGSGPAQLWVRFSDGAEHRIGFDDGVIEADGASIGRYEAGGRLVSRWRELLREQAGADGGSVRAALVDFHAFLEGADAPSLRDRLGEWLGLEVVEAPPADAIETAGRSIQLAPGRLGFDFTTALSRLESALERLGEVGDAVDDELAMVVHDDFFVPASRSIEGDVALVGGTLRLSGEVEGDVLILDGRLVMTDGSRVEGNILQVGGDLAFEGDVAIIEGEILADLPLAPEAPAEVPAVADAPIPPAATAARDSRDRGRRGWFGRMGYNVGEAAESLMEVLSAFVLLALLGMLLVRFSHGRLETVADTVRHEFARSFAMGLAGAILFFPALIILLVLVITWPIVPFFVLACGLAAAAGFVAVAHGAGEMFARKRYRYEWLERLRRSNSYYYVLSGLVLLLIPFFAVAVLWVLGGAAGVLRGLLATAAYIATMVLVTAGFGGVLLTRGGARSVVVDWGDSAEGESGHMEYAPVGDPDFPAPEAEKAQPAEEAGEDA